MLLHEFNGRKEVLQSGESVLVDLCASSRCPPCRGMNPVIETLAPGERDTPESALHTQGEIGAAICQGIRRVEQEYTGRGPKDIHAHLIDGLLVVRLQGVLTTA
jgi:hypothetical protein